MSETLKVRRSRAGRRKTWCEVPEGGRRQVRGLSEPAGHGGLVGVQFLVFYFKFREQWEMRALNGVLCLVCVFNAFFLANGL